jgi:mannose-6-phosphate isomerase-like protein (cupin superfamily)/predicted heme/steroid binding protein
MRGMNNMYSNYQTYPCPYYSNTPQYNQDIMYNFYNNFRCPYWANTPMNNSYSSYIQLKDYGPQPFVVNIEEATKQNTNFRTALWTGSHLQLTLMSIPVGGEIGLESHPNLDQFIRIEEGQGIVKMGDRKDYLDFQKRVYDDFAFIIPAGKWHNLINTGNTPIKLYSIYAPPQHPYGTVHVTKADADAAEEHSSRQIREFTLSELAQYDGTMGKPAYVAVDGIVYDVSNNSKWSGAVHFGLTAGKDLSDQFASCHGMSNKLAKLPKVGVLKI